MEGYYKTFKREKLLNNALILRYSNIVCKWFLKEFGVEVNEITIGWANDDFIQDKATIVFRHREFLKDKIFQNFLL